MPLRPFHRIQMEPMNINCVTADPHFTIPLLHPSHLLGLLQVYFMCSVPGLFMLSHPKLLSKVCCLQLGLLIL